MNGSPTGNEEIQSMVWKTFDLFANWGVCVRCVCELELSLNKVSIEICFKQIIIIWYNIVLKHSLHFFFNLFAILIF